MVFGYYDPKHPNYIVRYSTSIAQRTENNCWRSFNNGYIVRQCRWVGYSIEQAINEILLCARLHNILNLHQKEYAVDMGGGVIVGHKLHYCEKGDLLYV